MKMLMEDIKKQQFKNIYLLMGEETYLRNQYRKRLREALLDPEDTMNAASFEGKGINPKEIIDLAETMPFFAERRVIEIRDSGFAKNACPELADYIPDIPESTCLILTESEVDRRGRVYKAVKKSGRVVEFKRQDERTLARWVLGTLKKEGKSITEAAKEVRKAARVRKGAGGMAEAVKKALTTVLRAAVLPLPMAMRFLLRQSLL